MRIYWMIAVLVGVIGCKPEKPANTSAAEKARARVAAAQIESSDKEDRGAEPQSKGAGLTDEQKGIVVAQIGDVAITLGEVERQLASQPAFARARYRAFDKKVEFLNNLVQFELLATEAQQKGYDKDPDVVLAMKRAMIQKYMRTDMQKVVTVSSISDEEVQQYYDNNNDSFQKPELVRASHMLFKSKEKAESTLADLKASIEADKGRSRIIFNDFVRRLSEDQESATRNGDLGFFSADGYPEEAKKDAITLPESLVKAAFALGVVGEVSPVVQTDRGFHILQLTNKRPAVKRTLEDARRQITQVLLRRKKDAARDNFITSLRQKAKVEVFEDKLKMLDVDAIKTVPKDPAPPIPTAPAAPEDKTGAGVAPKKLNLPPLNQMANPARAVRLPKEARPDREPAKPVENKSQRAQAGGDD